MHTSTDRVSTRFTLRSVGRKSPSRHFAGSVMAFVGSLLLAAGLWAAGGDLLWEDRFDNVGGSARANAITAQGNRVFTAGGGVNAAGNSDLLVQANDAQTGDLLWEDQFDTGGQDGARAITAQGNRVFAAGSGSDDFVVRAYDAPTGDLLWEDQFDNAGGQDRASAITAQGDRVFAAGLVANAPSGGDDFVVRAYDAQTGDLFWENQFDTGGQDGARAITAHGNRVFAAGVGGSIDQDFRVRAYDTQTGDLLWEDGFTNGGEFAEAVAITAQGNRVFAAGRAMSPAFNFDFVVRAYDAPTGDLLWEDQFDNAEDTDQANAITAHGHRVFAAGFVEKAAGGNDFVVRAYDAR